MQALRQITTQRELRRQFWQAFPNLSRHKLGGHFGPDATYCCETRTAWCDWIDALAKSGEISEALADRATLD